MWRRPAQWHSGSWEIGKNRKSLSTVYCFRGQAFSFLSGVNRRFFLLLRLCQRLGVCKHELNSVLLIDFGRGRVIIDGHDIGVWVVVLEGTVGSSVAIRRQEGFKNAMAESADGKKFNILASQTGEFTRQKGQEVMESFLKSDRDKIDVLFAHNDDMALGAIQAIEAAGLQPGKDITIISIDGVKGIFQAMIDGKANCTVECNPLQGQLLMETAKKILKGEKVEKLVYVDEGIFPADVAAKTLPERKY